MTGNEDRQKSVAGSEEELTEERFLEAYKKKEYPKPSLTADIAVFRRLPERVEILLVRRGKHPYQGCWALPGGFAGPNEDVIEAARRELEEETGVAGASVELFGVYGAPGRDPRGWTVSSGFCALVSSDVGVRAGDDAADARWCAVEEKVVEGESAEGGLDGMRELRVECTDGETAFVRFGLVPQEFGAPRARVVDSDGFAFDHAQIFADAYLKVTQGSSAS